MNTNTCNSVLDVSRLNIHIIEESSQPVYTLCGHLCVVHRFCVAINYMEKVNGNEPNCQLTNTTKHKFAENAKTEDKVWTFRKVNADRSLLVSTRNRLNLIVTGGGGALSYHTKILSQIKKQLSSVVFDRIRLHVFCWVSHAVFCRVSHKNFPRWRLLKNFSKNSLKIFFKEF